MKDGEAEGEFTIKAAQVKPDDKQNGKNVNTGDSNSIVLWVVMIVIAAAVCTAVLTVFRKRVR